MQGKTKFLVLFVLVALLASGCLFGKKGSPLVVKLALEDGSPISSLKLTLKNSSKTYEGVTNVEGKVTFNNLNEDQYTLEGVIALYDGTEMPISEKVTVDAKNTAEKVIQVKNIGKIDVSLVEEVSGKPIDGIVRVKSGEQETSITLGATGKKGFYAKLGTFTLIGKKGLLESDPIEVTLTSAKVEQIIKLDYDGNPELAKGKKYELIGEVHSSSVDNQNTILTDGNYEISAWNDKSWLGLKNVNPAASKDVVYIVDLEKSNFINEVSGYFVQTSYGIDFPVKISVSVSEDKTTWTSPVEKSFPEKPETPEVTEWAVVNLTEPAKGRYVKMVITAKAEWIFCKEISIKRPLE